MKKVLYFSILLVVGLIGSQILPGLAGTQFPLMSEIISFLTMIGLAFIMIHVGYEFDINKSNLREYGWDYLVAMTAAAFPWILITVYFIYFMLPPESACSWEAWSNVLLVSRFSAPTSAGLLFSMLAAAGLSATWVFRKARILAIFDDLDTVLLMIPLTMMIVGPQLQLLLIVVIMTVLIFLAWRFLHQWNIPVIWSWVLMYAVLLVIITEAIYFTSKSWNSQVPLHIEVLLPAFVLGCMMKRPADHDPHGADARNGHREGPENPVEQKVSTCISAIFIFLVGLNMPVIYNNESLPVAAPTNLLVAQAMPGTGMLLLHILFVTLLSNLGKMYPAFCYRREANWKERLGLAIGMWPRGEVGAGILVIALGYGISGPIVTVAALSLTLNLILTGVFIWMVKRLIRK
jgi:Kef-type K+ transport system membrane component KefB